MNKYLFLDIDGVLNSNFYIWNFRKKNGRESNRDTDMIDEKRVAIFNSLFVLQPDLKVILSSSWRFLHSPSDMTSILKEKGYIGPDIIDETPSLASQRGNEVIDWLKTNIANPNDELYSFAALDDNSDFDIMRGFLIQTNGDYGIQEKHIKALNRLLSQELTIKQKQKLGLMAVE